MIIMGSEDTIKLCVEGHVEIKCVMRRLLWEKDKQTLTTQKVISLLMYAANDGFVRKWNYWCEITWHETSVSIFDKAIVMTHLWIK